MLTNYLAACAHLTITIYEIERDIGRKSSFFHTPLHSTPSLRGFPSEYRHPVWCEKTRLVWLPDGEKKFEDIFIRFDATHERDRRTDTACRHKIPRLCIHRAVIMPRSAKHCCHIFFVGNFDKTKDCHKLISYLTYSSL